MQTMVSWLNYFVTVETEIRSLISWQKSKIEVEQKKSYGTLQCEVYQRENVISDAWNNTNLRKNFDRELRRKCNWTYFECKYWRKFEPNKYKINFLSVFKKE